MKTSALIEVSYWTNPNNIDVPPSIKQPAIKQNFTPIRGI